MITEVIKTLQEEEGVEEAQTEDVVETTTPTIRKNRNRKATPAHRDKPPPSLGEEDHPSLRT